MDKRRQLTSRAQVDKRISHDPTTPSLHVVASPTDPMVFGSGHDSRAARLAEALGVIQQNKAVIDQAVSLGAERVYKEGALSAMKGEERPSTGMIRIQGWDTLKGELTARQEYRDELNSFFNDNHLELLPEEFEAGVREISNKYIQGASKSYLEGFLPQALDIEQSIFDKYNSTHRELVRQESMDMLSSKAHNTVVKHLTEYLQSRFEGIESLDDILTRPEVLWQLDVEGTLGAELAPILRADLSDAQRKGKQLGFTRHEVNQLYLEQVGELAVRYGMPELLDFLWLPDETGNAPIRSAAAGKTSFQYLSKSEAERKTTVNEYLKAIAKAEEEQKKALEEQLKERIEGIKKDFEGELISLEKLAEINPQLASEKAMTLLEAMFDESTEFYRVEATFHAKILRGALDLIAADTTFRKTSASDVVEQLIKLTNDKELTYEALLEARPYLSLNDWEKYINLLTKQEETKQSERLRTYRGEIANSILDIKHIQDREQRKSMALHYLRKLNEDSMFWELGYEATVGFRDDLYRLATEDIVFAQADDGETFRRLNEARYNGTLTQVDIMEASGLLTQSTWNSFLDALIKQDEQRKKEEEVRIEAELKRLAEEDKALREGRVSYYNNELGNARLMSSVESRKHLANLLEEFDTDSLVQGVAESTRNDIRNRIIEGILENRTYATKDNADDLLYAQLLQQVPEGTVTYEMIDSYVDNGLLTRDMHLSLLKEVRTKLEADAKELARQEEERRKQAEEAKLREKKEAEQAEQERREAARNQFMKELYGGISDLETLLDNPHELRVKAEELKRRLKEGDKEHDIPYSTYTSLYNSINRIIGESGKFAAESDREIIMLLEYQAIYNSLDYEELSTYADQGLLNKTDFLRFAGQYAAQLEIADKEQLEQNKANAEYVTDAIREIITLAVGGDPLGVNLSSIEQVQAASLRLGFLDANHEFVREYGRPPTREEFLGKIVPPVLREHGYSVTDTLKKFGRFDNEFLDPAELPITDRLSLEDLRFPEQKTGWGPFKKTVTDENPEFRLSKMDAYKLFNGYFERGLSISEVLTAVNADLLNTGGQPLLSEEARSFYVQNYADMTAAHVYLENYDPITGQPDTFRTHEIIYNKLSRQGFTEYEILQAMYMGRVYLDMALKERRGSR